MPIAGCVPGTGSIDAEGYVFISDRKKDLIIVKD